MTILLSQNYKKLSWMMLNLTLNSKFKIVYTILFVLLLMVFNFSYSDNELPISSIANVLLPSDSHKIGKDEVHIPKLLDYQTKLNENKHDYSSEIIVISNSKENKQDNSTSSYECDICGKVFPKRTQIVEHFRTSLCFPEIPSFLINNNSFNHHLCKNPKNVLLHLNSTNNLVTSNLKMTHVYKNVQILNTKENNLKYNFDSRLNRITYKNHKYVHPKNTLFNCDKYNKSYIQLDALKKHKVINLFRCPICHENFFEKSSLKAHKRIHDLKSVNQCNICQKYFKSKSSVSKHIRRIHNLTQEYECSRCSKVFYKRYEIVNHIFKNHQEDYSKYSCESCSKLYEFSNNSFYSLKKSYYKCDVCPRSFTSSHRLDQHYRWHLDINDFNCKHCSQQFSKFSVYLSHEKTHVGEKPFRCNFCGKWFPISSNINIHVGYNNIFVCKFCEKIFSHMSLLLSHEKIHLQKEQSKSKSLNKLFNQLSNLRLHTQKRCTNRKQYKCNKSDIFIRSSTFRSHSQTHVIKNVQENDSDSNIETKPSFIKHMDNGRFKCDLCHEIFFDQKMFTTHKCTKNPTSSFKKNHGKIYKNNKLFKCDVCFTSFVHSTSLNRHKKRHLEFEKNLSRNNYKKNTDNFINQDYKCDLCMEVFNNQTQICAHILENHY